MRWRCKVPYTWGTYEVKVTDDPPHFETEALEVALALSELPSRLTPVRWSARKAYELKILGKQYVLMSAHVRELERIATALQSDLALASADEKEGRN